MAVCYEDGCLEGRVEDNCSEDNYFWNCHYDAGTACHNAYCHDAEGAACHDVPCHGPDCHDAEGAACHDAPCHDVDCHDVECHDAPCHDADCHDAEGVPCHDAACHDALCDPTTRCNDSSCLSETPDVQDTAQILKSLTAYQQQQQNQYQNPAFTIPHGPPVYNQTSYSDQSGLSDPYGSDAMSMGDMPQVWQMSPNLSFPLFERSMFSPEALVNHVVQNHPPSQPENCISPSCLIGHQTEDIKKCPLPRDFPRHPNEVTDGQLAGLFPNPPVQPQPCNAPFTSNEEVARHLWAHVSTSYPQQFQQYAQQQYPTPDSLDSMFTNEQERFVDMRRSSSLSTSRTRPSDETGTQTPLSIDGDLLDDSVIRCKWLTDPGNEEVCGKEFSTQKELQEHCRDEHTKHLSKDTNKGGFPCQWQGCDRLQKDRGNFAQKSKLERHLQTHTRYKPVWCEVCGLFLSAPQSLVQHMRTHTGEMPWKCTWEGCSMAFKQQSALTMHIRVHTKKRPLFCRICNASYSESGNLGKHMRRQHNLPDDNHCPVCFKGFTSRTNMLRHFKARHSETKGGLPAIATSGSLSPESQ